jgi:hypothetical protein
MSAMEATCTVRLITTGATAPPHPPERDGSNQERLFGKENFPLRWGWIDIEGWNEKFQGGLINPTTLDWDYADESQTG